MENNIKEERTQPSQTLESLPNQYQYDPPYDVIRNPNVLTTTPFPITPMPNANTDGMNHTPDSVGAINMSVAMNLRSGMGITQGRTLMVGNVGGVSTGKERSNEENTKEKFKLNTITPQICGSSSIGNVHPKSYHKAKRKRCFCFGSSLSDSIKSKSSSNILASLLTNLGICILLLAYTLLGKSYII